MSILFIIIVFFLIPGILRGIGKVIGIGGSNNQSDSDKNTKSESGIDEQGGKAYCGNSEVPIPADAIKCPACGKPTDDGHHFDLEEI